MRHKHRVSVRYDLFSPSMLMVYGAVLVGAYILAGSVSERARYHDSMANSQNVERAIGKEVIQPVRKLDDLGEIK